LRAAHRNGLPFISLNLNPSIEEKFKKKNFNPIQHHKNFYTQQLSIRRAGAIYDSADAVQEQLYSDNQQATILYLYCHGRNTVPFSADNSEQLELDTNIRLAPADLRAYQNIYERAPIVFLNSCTSGQPSPISFSSFHAAFRQKKAMGMIGTSIEIPATFGASFGCKLLEKYIGGMPLGVAIFDLRRELVCNGNPLGLFYSLQCPDDVAALSIPSVKNERSDDDG